MSLGHGLKVSRNELVLQCAMNNPKSWRGEPTTNLANTSAEAVDWSVGNLTASVTRTEIVPNKRYKITNNGLYGSFRFYFNLTNLVNGATYTMSFKWKIVSGAGEFRLTDWCDQSISRTVTYLGNDTYYETATGTRATYDSTYRFMDAVIYDNIEVEVWDVQLEQKSYATPYTSYTRSNTEAVLDLTGNSTLTASNLVYASDNTFSFDDTTNSYINTGKNRETMFPSIDTYSYMCVAKRNGAPSTAHTHAVVFGAQGYNTGLLWYNSDNKVRMGAWYDNAGSWASKATDAGTTAISDDTWVHLAGTFNAYGNMCCYVNGELISAVDVYGNTVSSDNTWYNGTVSIGGGTSAYQFNGSVAEALGYNRELSAEEIAEHFENVRGRYGI